MRLMRLSCSCFYEKTKVWRWQDSSPLFADREHDFLPWGGRTAEVADQGGRLVRNATTFRIPVSPLYLAGEGPSESAHLSYFNPQASAGGPQTEGDSDFVFMRFCSHHYLRQSLFTHDHLNRHRCSLIDTASIEPTTHRLFICYSSATHKIKQRSSSSLLNIYKEIHRIKCH